MSSKKYRQIKVSATEENYQQIKERATSLGLTTAAYLRMLAGQDLDRLRFQVVNSENDKILPELIEASKGSIPQIVVVRESSSSPNKQSQSRGRRSSLKSSKSVAPSSVSSQQKTAEFLANPRRKKTVTREAIWQFL